MKNEQCERCGCWDDPEENPVVLEGDELICLACISGEEIDWDLWEKSARGQGI